MSRVFERLDKMEQSDDGDDDNGDDSYNTLFADVVGNNISSPRKKFPQDFQPIKY